MEDLPKNMLHLLFTFCGLSTRGYLLRDWQDCTALVGFEGVLGPYCNFMPLFWDRGAYRDLISGSPVGIVSLRHLPPNPELHGVRVSVHRQVSPERTPSPQEDTTCL
jgi:hypothetical protein